MARSGGVGKGEGVIERSRRPIPSLRAAYPLRPPRCWHGRTCRLDDVPIANEPERSSGTLGRTGRALPGRRRGAGRNRRPRFRGAAPAPGGGGRSYALATVGPRSGRRDAEVDRAASAIAPAQAVRCQTGITSLPAVTACRHGRWLGSQGSRSSERPSDADLNGRSNLPCRDRRLSLFSRSPPGSQSCRDAARRRPAVPVATLASWVLRETPTGALFATLSPVAGKGVSGPRPGVLARLGQSPAKHPRRGLDLDRTKYIEAMRKLPAYLQRGRESMQRVAPNLPTYQVGPANGAASLVKSAETKVKNAKRLLASS